MSELKIRRALLSVSDKTGIVELGHALSRAGVELVATGNTAQVLKDAGLKIVPIESVSGSPEAFQGRMKTLSFPVCSGILYRRGDASDEKDLKSLNFLPIDCVVVNFYPFEKTVAKEGSTRKDWIENIDIGGPTLVRSAAKNAPDVLVLTDPTQYPEVIRQLNECKSVQHALVHQTAQVAWSKISNYDLAIARQFGGEFQKDLRYGENPHQSAKLFAEPHSPIAWNEKLTSQELSYNNILDLASAYHLASDLKKINPEASSVVIVKHNNPCGVALIPKSSVSVGASAQKVALLKAWDGDAVSAFGGVLAFTDPIEEDTAEWLAERFVELVGAPELKTGCRALSILTAKRKNLKAVRIERWGAVPEKQVVNVPGGHLIQTSDLVLDEQFKSVTKKEFASDLIPLARFGIAIARSLKSNALSIVREISGISGSMQLVGAGQGQPNRVEALEKLALPRAQSVLTSSGGRLLDCILVSDAFFPFRDTVDTAARAGIRKIVQPGGSIKDSESIAACDEQGVAMAVTGIRHFKH